MEQGQKVIKFYRASEGYGCFSNFSRHHVFLDDQKWPTSEHYFQAQKFAGTPHEERVRRTKTPGDAAKMGRDRGLPLRKDWENVKDEIMYEVVKAKFSQHDDLRNILLGTADATIVESTANDSYWGDGGNGTGKNQLGKTLMRVRTELLAEKGPSK